MPKKRPNLYDVAREARVSPATVSRVVAGNPTVDPAIRAQVRKAAEKLGVDLDERRKGKSRIIAFILANRDVLHAFQARVLLGAEAYCSQHNWELLFLSFRYTPEVPSNALHLPQILSDRTNARAVILGGQNYPNLIHALQARGLPFSVLGNNVVGEWKSAECDVAYSDDINGTHEATHSLLSRGHTAIAFIGNLQLPWYHRCAAGYRRAMKEAGLEPRCWDLRSDGTQLGYLAAKALLAKGPRPTAILAGNDQVAAGVYDVLREAKISVPRDMSVMGINDTQGSLLSPPLSSLRTFPEELGRHMAEFVIERLQNPTLPPQEISIPTQLVHRDSVAAPAARAASARRASRASLRLSA
jgi:DNA-binding LacI/PurR family transcriptional regulator